jgi:hypothetical protein
VLGGWPCRAASDWSGTAPPRCPPVPRVRREGEQVRLGMPLLPIVACTVGVFMGTNGNFWLTGAAFFALMAIDIGNSNG